VSVYEIRVNGHLGWRWPEWFDGLEVTNLENGEAVLLGDRRPSCSTQRAG